MTPPATSRATHRPGTSFAGAVPRTGPVPLCPGCAAELDGGPVAYWCPGCGRGVMAADLDISYHPPGPGRAGRAREED
jgi:hypothetical protein